MQDRTPIAGEESLMKSMAYVIFASLLSAPLVIPSIAKAIDNCGPTPPDYRERQYGDALYSLETPCQRTLSPKEQVFVAGASQYLLSQCGLPADLTSRLKLQKFLLSSAFVGAIGRQYGNPDLGQGLGDQASSMAAYGAGEATAKAIGCTDAGKRLAKNVVKYLDRTAEGSPDKPNYVDGCARYYSVQYSKKQCRCLADIGRSVFPNIYEMEFSPSTIKQIIASNPFVGLQIAIQCGIGDY